MFRRKIKRKKNARRALIEKLDRVFSVFIRLRDSDRDGFATCCTCGVKKHWKEMHAGHYVGREAMNTRFEECNVHVQCVSCNSFHEGRKPEYTLFLQKKYYPEIVEQLVVAGKRTKKWAPIELEALIRHYTEEVEKLKRGNHMI